MSADEIAWRIQSKSRDLIDRVRIVTGRWPKLQDALSSVPKKPPFRLCVGETGCWTSSHLHHEEEEWKADLLRKAESVLENKLSYFNLRDHFHGYPFNWNRDQNIGKDSPLCFAQSIDYRNVEKAGDCKLIWEPNRCHHIVVLGRAYRASGDIKFAHGVVEHITSWMDCNPYGRGMNWRSPMELAIRIINWAWALDFIYETKLFSGEFRVYGRMIILDHGGGFYTIYGQLDDIFIEEGQIINAYDPIGTISGDDEPVLYFEVRSDATAEDPMLWLK